MEREIYEYKEYTYYIESSAKMKNPITREWEDCIIYIQLETGNRYVRLTKDFLEKFKMITS